MAEQTEPYITLNRHDETAILFCPRQSCMRPPEFGFSPDYWTTEIDDLTPEEVVVVRDEHLKEMHR